MRYLQLNGRPEATVNPHGRFQSHQTTPTPKDERPPFHIYVGTIPVAYAGCPWTCAEAIVMMDTPRMWVECLGHRLNVAVRKEPVEENVRRLTGELIRFAARVHRAVQAHRARVEGRLA